MRAAFQKLIFLTSTASCDMLEQMKIVICDDSIEDLIKIEKILRKYTDFYVGTEFVIEKYSIPVKLYEQIGRKELADIFILDMLMAEKTGIDIASQVRKFSGKNVIIYVTSSDDFALEAYRVHAARYLLKPVREEDFFEAMDYAMSCTQDRRDSGYLIKTKGGFVSIPCSRIEYIENVSRILDIRLTDGESIKSIFIRKSFDSEIEGLLKGGGFLQVHKSFVVNLKYVRKITQNNVIMESGKSIPISKARSAGVKREYLLYVSEQYR